MSRILAITFKDYPNVIQVFDYQDASAEVELRLFVRNPRSGLPVPVFYKGKTSGERTIYFYSEVF